MSRSNPRIGHLQFANDFHICGRTNPLETRQIEVCIQKLQLTPFNMTKMSMWLFC